MKARGGGQAFAGLAAGPDSGDGGPAGQARLARRAAIREEPIDLMAEAVNSGPDPAMICVTCLKLCPFFGWVGKVFRHPAHQKRMVALQREKIIAAPLQDHLRRIALGVQAASTVTGTPLRHRVSSSARAAVIPLPPCGTADGPMARRAPAPEAVTTGSGGRPAAGSNDRRSVLPLFASTPGPSVPRSSRTASKARPKACGSGSRNSRLKVS